ncbi:MAG: peptidoglycan-binding domain-containing protein [Gammaproteobacteria bacterium]
MQINRKKPLFPGFIAAITCAIGGLVAVTAFAEDALQEQEKALLERVQKLQQQERDLENKISKMQGREGAAFMELEDVLPTAKPGQCFSKVLVPAVYEDRTEKVLVREAANKIEITPPEYMTAIEKVTIEEAGEDVVEVPAVYKTVKEDVLVEKARFIWRKGLEKQAKPAPNVWVSAALAHGVPKDAPANGCFEEFRQNAVYETVEEKIIKKQAGTRIEIIPAVYEWEEKKILVKEASEKIVEVPPVFETVEEKVLKRAAYSTWKRGRGPIERVDHSTGEIMCLVEVPAEYETIKKTIVKTPAATKKVEIPAEYKTIKIRKLITPAREKVIEIPETYQTVKKKVLKSPAITEWRPENTVGDGFATGKKICHIEIPARYQTLVKEMLEKPATTKKIPVPAKLAEVKVKKLVSPAKAAKQEIPAEYDTLQKRVKISDEKLAWRSVLCETNTTKDLLADIQTALQKAGFYSGTIDGSLGRQTQAALEEFQKDKGLETGGITLRTLDMLGVKVGGGNP